MCRFWRPLYELSLPSDSLKYLKAFPEGQKTLVFSQFTKFLDAIAPHLRAAGIPFVRFDGSMSAKKRAEIIDQFQQPIELDEGGSETEESEEEEDLHSSRKKGKGKAKPKIRSKKSAAENPAVMLISLKSGSVGINLTAAQVSSLAGEVRYQAHILGQNVFLMDPWWQNAVEAQAIDRVNRIVWQSCGASKPSETDFVYRVKRLAKFACSRSVECLLSCRTG